MTRLATDWSILLFSHQISGLHHHLKGLRMLVGQQERLKWKLCVCLLLTSNHGVQCVVRVRNHKYTGVDRVPVDAARIFITAFRWFRETEYFFQIWIAISQHRLLSDKGIVVSVRRIEIQ